MITQRRVVLRQRFAHALLAVFAVCALPSAAEAQTTQSRASAGQVQSWRGNFTDKGEPETLTLRGDLLYLYQGGSEPPLMVGSVKGYNLGKAGIYVANLDGNDSDRQTLAFFDPDRHSWFWGKFDGGVLMWTAVGEDVGGKVKFQVGNGPMFFPVDEVDGGQGADAAGLQSFAAQPRASTPFTLPAEGTQYNALARSQHVWTHFIVEPDGNVYASTRVKEDTLLAGFHAGVSIYLFSQQDLQNPLWTVKVPSTIGVTGTLFGHSDVTVSWQGLVPQQLLPRLRYYAVVQTWEPDWYTLLREAKKLAEYINGIVKPLESLKQ